MTYSGQITAWLSSKSYGFIRRTDVKQDHFFHQSQIKTEFLVGDYVEFELGPANVLGKPLQAVNVRVVKGLADLANTEAVAQ
jgi:cold shock CspA family protein